MTQGTFNFETQAPINRPQLSGQNGRLFDWLNSGKTINTINSFELLGVRYLNSRISDLRNAHNISITDRFIKVSGLDVKEYYIKPEHRI